MTCEIPENLYYIKFGKFIIDIENDYMPDPLGLYKKFDLDLNKCLNKKSWKKKNNEKNENIIITCSDCGGRYRERGISTHISTKKHQRALLKKEILEKGFL